MWLCLTLSVTCNDCDHMDMWEKKKFAELKALLVLEPVNLVIKKSRLCRDVKCRDDIDWVKDCVTTELD